MFNSTHTHNQAVTDDVYEIMYRNPYIVIEWCESETLRVIEECWRVTGGLCPIEHRNRYLHSSTVELSEYRNGGLQKVHEFVQSELHAAVRALQEHADEVGVRLHVHVEVDYLNDFDF